MEESETEIVLLLDKSFEARTSRLDLSIDYSKAALGLCNDSKHSHLKAKALLQLSLYYLTLGRYDESFNSAQQGIQIFEQLADEIGVAQGKYNLAGFHFRTNNFQLSVVNAIDALIISKNNSDFTNISRCEKLLGSIYQYIGDEQKATDSFKNAIKAAKKINDLNLESNAYNNLSNIYLKNDNLTLASDIILKAVSIKEESNDIRGLAFAIYGRGKVFYAQKKYNDAEADFLESIDIHKKTGDKLGLAMGYNKLAHLYFTLNKIALAKAFLKLGVDLCNLYSIGIIKIKLTHLSYLIHKAENDVAKAFKYLEQYNKERALLFNTQNLILIENYDLLIRIQTLQKDSESAHQRTKLIAQNTKIKEVAGMRQEFLSNMSHEIRTPLNAVITIATILSDDTDIKDRTLVESLKFSSNHLLQLINDVLDYTRLDLGKMKLDFRSTNLKLFLDGFWNTYKIQTRDKAVEFKIKIDPDLSEFYFLDETKTTQILGNLVSNAIKFTDVGEVILEVKVGKKSEDSDLVLFQVSDTGIGIEKKNFEKMFENFSQLRSGITRKKDGVGIGLAITKKLVELYDSEIVIESIVGKGSTFSFELNLKKNQKAKSVPAVETELNSPENNQSLVLIAEDNAINAMIAIKLLTTWGFKTDLAKDGLEATEKSKQTKYDFILMDIHMPVLDGYQAAKNIRTLENLNKTTPIFGLTADIAAKDNNEYNGYFDDFFLKPIEVEKLKVALNSNR